jgi:hypothetical protein
MSYDGNMLSKKHRWLYIHIPKTGGNSIQTILYPYSEDRILIRKSGGHVKDEDGAQGLGVFNDELGLTDNKAKHATLSVYSEKLGERIKELFLFASIRNPYDRVISVTAFGGAIVKSRKLLLTDIRLPKKQIDYVTLNGHVAISHFIRFENMQNDFGEICKRIGIPICKLPHKNSSQRERDYDLYLSPAVKKYLYSLYYDDFHAFGYSP